MFTLHLHPPLTACADPHLELPLTITGTTVRPAKEDTITMPSNLLTLRSPLRWAPIIFKRILSSLFHQSRSIPFVRKPHRLALHHRALHKVRDLRLHSPLHIHIRFPSISHAPLYRPSFERTATSTTAIALDPSGRLGPNIAGFAGAGARPGYDAYGFESRTAGATSPNYNGAIVHRPSIESIRNLARKASQPNLPSEPTYPPAGGYTRTRNNSTSTYAGSVRAGKVKPTKEEKAKEMAAMDNLIAALDESAEAERRRKERLVAAAGILDNQQGSSKKGTGTDRRNDAAITGSYPLPPPEVFRAALSRGVADADDEPDDNEIERWRRN